MKKFFILIIIIILIFKVVSCSFNTVNKTIDKKQEYDKRIEKEDKEFIDRLKDGL